MSDFLIRRCLNLFKHPPVMSSETLNSKFLGESPQDFALIPYLHFGGYNWPGPEPKGSYPMQSSEPSRLREGQVSEEKERRWRINNRLRKQPVDEMGFLVENARGYCVREHTQKNSPWILRIIWKEFESSWTLAEKAKRTHKNCDTRFKSVSPIGRTQFTSPFFTLPFHFPHLPEQKSYYVKSILTMSEMQSQEYSPSRGCHNRTQTGWLKQQAFISHSSRGREVQGPGASMVRF